MNEDFIKTLVSDKRLNEIHLAEVDMQRKFNFAVRHDVMPMDCTVQVEQPVAVISQCCNSHVHIRRNMVFCGTCGKEIEIILPSDYKITRNKPTLLWKNPDTHNIRLVKNYIINSLVTDWVKGKRKKDIKKNTHKLKLEAMGINNCNWRKALKTHVFPKLSKKGLTFKSKTGRLFFWEKGGMCIDVSYRAESYIHLLGDWPMIDKFVHACIDASISDRPEYEIQLERIRTLHNEGFKDLDALFTLIRRPNLVNLCEFSNSWGISIREINYKIRKVLDSSDSGIKLMKELFGLSKTIVLNRREIPISIKVKLNVLFGGGTMDILKQIKYELPRFTIRQNTNVLSMEISPEILASEMLISARDILNGRPKLKRLVLKELRREKVEFVLNRTMDVCSMYDNIAKMVRLDKIPILSSLDATHNAMVRMYNKHLYVLRALKDKQYLPHRYRKEWVDGYLFSEPHVAGDLSIMGKDQDHCIFGYVDRIINRGHNIVFMYNEDGGVEICIDVYKENIIQAKMSHNRKPSKELDDVINKWAKAHELNRYADERFNERFGDENEVINLVEPMPGIRVGGQAAGVLEEVGAMANRAIVARVFDDIQF